MIYLGRDQVGLNQLMSSSSGGTLPSLVFTLDSMPNTTGSYTHTTSIQGVTSTMKPIMIEYSNPSAFLGNVTVTCDNGSITLSCPNVSGASEISVTVTDLSSSSQTTVFPVEDVQINGTSIVNNGIANIPLVQNSTTATPGLVRVYWGGLQVDSNGFLKINPATSSEIKAATASYVTVSPAKQHESTFYGLATAAGDTSQKVSANNVGIYTPEAKKAIREMFGVPNFESELIRDIITEEDAAQIDISSDISGQPFELRAAKIHVQLPASTTGSRDYITLTGTFMNMSNTATSLSFPTLSMATAAKSLNVYEFEAFNGMYFVRAGASTGWNMSTNSMISMNHDQMLKSLTSIRIKQYSQTSTLIPAGTRIKIVGIRI